MSDYSNQVFHILDDSKEFPGLQYKLGTSLTFSRTYRDAIYFINRVPRVDILFLDGYLDRSRKGSDYLRYLEIKELLSKIDTIAFISNSNSMNMEMAKLLMELDEDFVEVEVSHPVVEAVQGALYTNIDYVYTRKGKSDDK